MFKNTKKEIEYLKEKINSLNSRLEKVYDDTTKKFYYLENPPRFKKGDKVKYNRLFDTSIYTIVNGITHNILNEHFTYKYTIMREDFTLTSAFEENLIPTD
jgi:hypothetical protein